MPFGGSGQLRKLERRFALSGEYAIKAIYAGVIGFGTNSAYAPDEVARYLVAAGWHPVEGDAAKLVPVATLDRGYTLLAVPRYDAFRDALLGLAEHADETRLAEIGGSEVVTFSGIAPAGWSAPAGTTPIVAYRVPTDPSRTPHAAARRKRRPCSTCSRE